tara:strand:- start:273 stop:1154 length:882 start_codon:yes stop_codon:yes gene_type:complete
MSTYSINQFSEITGITKFVLRTWENRYGFLKPERSDTNIRIYTDEMLVRALNTNFLLMNNYKISKISKLNDLEIVNEIESLIDDKLDNVIEFYINEIIISAINFDGQKFHDTYNEGIEKFGLVNFYRDVILVTMKKIGLLWLSNKVSPSQEHFLSEQIKQKISVSINDAYYKNQSGKTWLLFLPENEFHEIGLLFTKFLLVQNGNNVVYLGSNVPYGTLIDVIEKRNIDATLLFAVTNGSKNNLSYTANYLNSVFKDSEHYVITHDLNIDRNLISNLKIFDNIDNFIKEISNK